uniref:ABC transporter domain-containing protein n=1 Tax=Lutzomyia longipalpis TaxID=7200 RepID=A0A1B0CG10_LUTLO
MFFMPSSGLIFVAIYGFERQNLDCSQIFCYLRSVSKIHEKVKILKGISGKFLSGRICAIMGPSGAGKSSLLNILSGFKTTLEDGEILINGKYCNRNKFKKKSCYILQDINLHRELTTLETLKIAADFKFPSIVSVEEKMEIVLNVLRILGLTAKSSTRVEHLSGGECKRLSIALDLLTNPPVMFLDEPTSGLDSVSAVQVITHLKDLARAGRNVICVIHQPSSRLLELFDDIFIMCNGQCIYNGPLDNMVAEFEEAGFECPQFYNRADFALEIASGERLGSLDNLINKVTRGIHCVTGEILKDQENFQEEFLEFTKVLDKQERKRRSLNRDIDQKYPISQWKQFLILLKRSFVCISRNFVVTQLKILTHLFIGLVVGWIYYNVGNDDPSESKIFYREYLNNWYGFLPYFYSKIIVEIPCLVISTFSTLIPIYYLTNQPMEIDRFFLLANIHLLTMLIALFAGLATGTQFGTEIGMFFMPSSGLIFVVFCGYYIRYNELSPILQPLTFITFFRYIFEGSFQAIYGFERQNLDCSQIFCYLRSVSKIREVMDMTENTYLLDVL